VHDTPPPSPQMNFTNPPLHPINTEQQQYQYNPDNHSHQSPAPLHRPDTPEEPESQAEPQAESHFAALAPSTTKNHRGTKSSALAHLLQSCSCGCGNQSGEASRKRTRRKSTQVDPQIAQWRSLAVSCSERFGYCCVGFGLDSQRAIDVAPCVPGISEETRAAHLLLMANRIDSYISII